MKTRTTLYLTIAAALAIATLFVNAKDSTAADVNSRKIPGADKSANTGAKVDLSFDVTEIVRMSEAGVDPEVIRTYAEKSTSLRNPTAEEIIYLHQHGISPQIATALIHRSAELSAQNASANKVVPAQMVQPSPPTVVRDYLQVPAPSSGPVLNDPVGYHYPTYNYGYPGYSYSYYTAPLYYGYSYRPYYRTCYPFTGYRSYSPVYYPRFNVSLGFGAARFRAGSPGFGHHGRFSGRFH